VQADGLGRSRIKPAARTWRKAQFLEQHMAPDNELRLYGTVGDGFWRKIVTARQVATGW